MNWDMVSAVAQVAGALATFAAVAVSLWLAVGERRPRLKLRVTTAAIIGAGWDEDFINFEVVNRGSRPVKITGYGWQVGTFKKDHMMINHDPHAHAYQPTLPYDLAPGDHVSFINRIDSFLEETDRLWETFTLRLPWDSRVPRRLVGHVWTADGFSVRSRATKYVVRLLMQRNPAVLMGARMRERRATQGLTEI